MPAGITQDTEISRNFDLFWWIQRPFLSFPPDSPSAETVDCIVATQEPTYYHAKTYGEQRHRFQSHLISSAIRNG